MLLLLSRNFKSSIAKRGIKWTFWKRNKPSLEIQEKEDIGFLNNFQSLCSSLEHLHIHSEHPLREISRKIHSEVLNHDQTDKFQKDLKLSLTVLEAKVASIANDFQKDLENYRAIADNPGNELVISRCQTGIRLFLLQNYLKSLRTKLYEGDIKTEKLDVDKMLRLVDSFMIGSSSERISGTTF